MGGIKWVEHVDFTDGLLESSMQTLMNLAPLAMACPEDYDVRPR